MIAKQIYNISFEKQDEPLMNAKLIGGNPTGIVDFNTTPHPWAYDLFKKMLQRNWIPEQVDVSKDKKRYKTLTENERRAFDLAIAQLTTNDSIQVPQLVERLSSYITSPVVVCALTRQAFEEVIHSQSYSIIAETLYDDKNKIFTLHNVDPVLKQKNIDIGNMYIDLYKSGDIEYEDILLCFVANLILEHLVFPGGFAIILSMKDKISGSCEMIQEILKDELQSHVPLFLNIFRTAVIEKYNDTNNLPTELKSVIKEKIKKYSLIEIEWMKYTAKGLLGFSEDAIECFIKHRANALYRSLNLDMTNVFEMHTETDPIGKIIRSSLQDIRSNFFEVNNKEYTKNKLGTQL